MLSLLLKLKEKKYLTDLNYQFAKLIHEQQKDFSYTQEQKDLAIFLAALVSFNVMKGHSCINLNSDLINNPFKLNNENDKNEILKKIGGIEPLQWQKNLQNHIAFSHNPEQVAPLLFQGNRLYFYRYWQAENRIAQKMQAAAQSDLTNDEAEIALNKTVLNQLFPPVENTVFRQKMAVATALKQRLTFISGGPGTGKTYTVAMLLAALQLKQLKQNSSPLSIALAAPTGKAAARLKESILNTIQRLAIPDYVKQLVPSKAQTIHRLLGIRPNSDKPLFNAENPLHLDLLIVDEASMIDLFLFEKLLNATKLSTRLIFLGDKDQLASVEAGNVMSELGSLLNSNIYSQPKYSPQHIHYLNETIGYTAEFLSDPSIPTICDSLCELTESRRFGENSGIGKLAKEINNEQAVRAWQLFTNPTFQDLVLMTYPKVENTAEKKQAIQQSVQFIAQKAVELYRPYLELVKQREAFPQQVSIREIFHAFNQVRFLSALRVSELGVEQLNQIISEALKRVGLIQFKHHRENYLGKPILITENAVQNHIFSGDIGLVLPDETGKKAKVYFETEVNEQNHTLSLSRLPNYEPAYVMTVHKSQGSEFAHTLLIMPHTTSPVLTKELLYTAVTRAKDKFTLFSYEHIWRKAVENKVQRQSGLKEQLLTFK